MKYSPIGETRRKPMKGKKKLGRDVTGVTTPEHKWLKHRPYLWVSPMLGKNISWVFITTNVKESKDGCSNGFTDAMIREDGVALVKFRLGNGSTVNN